MINLKKNQTINLQKDLGLQHVRIGLSWDADPFGGKSADCDVSVFMLGENQRIPSDAYFVFYNNLKSPDGAVIHHGDNLTGEGDGDDEVIDVDLGRIAPEVEQLLFVITIHNSSDGFNFGNVRNATARLYDQGKGEVKAQYVMMEGYPQDDSVVLCRVFRNQGRWEFETMDQTFSGGLQTCVDHYA